MKLVLFQPIFWWANSSGVASSPEECQDFQGDVLKDESYTCMKIVDIFIL
jgi:hypothetical protein